MNREPENPTTADMANAGSQSPTVPITDRSNGGTSVPVRRVIEPEPAGRQSYEDEEPVDVEAEAAPIDAGEKDSTAAPKGDVVTGPLFDPYVAKDLQGRWNEIQVAFVDEPRAAVERADSLVAETTRCLEDSFAAGRRKLESEWDRGGNVSTETLRLAIQRYRSFFNRLLAL